ncbi:MAG: hypothetical protein ACI8RD_013406 [Bacillariaceae sp.]|jgi:hypothetical protein
MRTGPIRPDIEIAFLHTNTTINHTFECPLSLEDPFSSIELKLVNIYHRKVRDIPDYRYWSPRH